MNIQPTFHLPQALLCGVANGQMFDALPLEDRTRMGGYLGQLLKWQNIRFAVMLEHWADNHLTEAYNPALVTHVFHHHLRWRHVKVTCAFLGVEEDQAFKLALQDEPASQRQLITTVSDPLKRLTCMMNAWPDISRPTLSRYKREKFGRGEMRRVEERWTGLHMVKNVRLGQNAFTPSGGKNWTFDMTKIALQTLKLDAEVMCQTILEQMPH